VLQRGLQMCDAIADAVFDFVKAALTALEDYLSYQWNLASINPVLKFILEKLGVDPTMSLNRLVSLVAAFPLTIVREATGLSPVFSPGQSAGRSVGSTATSDTGDRFCYTVATISQFVWTMADIGGDFEQIVAVPGGARPQQPGIIDYFDIICPILETLLLMPGRDNTLVWNGLPTDKNLPGLIAPSILTSLIPPVFKIAQKSGYVPSAPSEDPDVLQFYKDAPTPIRDSYSQYYSPIVSTVAGLANVSLSCIYNYRNAASTGSKVEAIAGPVLGDASNIASWLAAYYINASTEDLPVIIKLIIDGVGGFGAGAIMAGNISS
jgi:hypothetical protein